MTMFFIGVGYAACCVAAFFLGIYSHDKILGCFTRGRTHADDVMIALLSLLGPIALVAILLAGGVTGVITPKCVRGWLDKPSKLWAKSDD